MTETLLDDGYRTGLDPFMEAAGGGSRLGGGLAELRYDMQGAGRWLRRGGVKLGVGVSGMERGWFQSGQISIGDQTYLNARCWLEGAGRIDIGSYTGLGPEVLVLTSYHPRASAGFQRAAEYLDVRIGDRCWLGARVIVMPGVTIGDDVVVGSGAIVTRDLPSGGTYAGIPAKRIA
jgi:acetyltransferase-like isoleucine patch superfamily enzyme